MIQELLNIFINKNKYLTNHLTVKYIFNAKTRLHLQVHHQLNNRAHV